MSKKKKSEKSKIDVRKAPREMPMAYGLLAACLLFTELQKADRLLTLRILWRMIPTRHRFVKRLKPARGFAPFNVEGKAVAR